MRLDMSQLRSSYACNCKQIVGDGYIITVLGEMQTSVKGVFAAVTSSSCRKVKLNYKMNKRAGIHPCTALDRNDDIDFLGFTIRYRRFEAEWDLV
ncbi:hypothetical protein BDR04DRAFT_787276 [Suillus decipiens]|nr:hypothetical protein BDR04DRAFT_787276 [Suillus decipiens]